MTPGKCCVSGQASQRLTHRMGAAVAALLPVTALLFLPKCPLCLAAWLTVSTGVSFSASGGAWVRTSILAVWVATMALIIWRKAVTGAAPTYSSG